jgi:hypothetical protein
MAGKSKPKLDPTTVVVAVIGLVGTIVAAVITTRGSGSSTQETPPPTSISVVTEVSAPTVVAVASETPGVSIPVVSDTPTSPPLLTVGDDWDQNCISAAWQAYPATPDTTVADGCYVNLFNSVFSAQSGTLTFFVDKRVDTREVSGIFAKIPSNSLVSLNIHLEDLQGGELWIGVFDEPNPESNGYVLAIQPGNAKNSSFIALGMPSATNVYSTGKYPKDTGNYSVSLDVTPNTIFALIEQYTKTSSFSLSSSEKWLFLGYRALTSGRNRMEGNFFDLSITSR